MCRVTDAHSSVDNADGESIMERVVSEMNLLIPFGLDKRC